MTSLPPLLEREVSRTVCDFLKAHGWRLLRMNVTTMQLRGQWVRFGEAGMPDYLALYYLPYGQAVVLWLEFKSKTGKRSKQQEVWHQCEERYGGTVYTVRDFDSFYRYYCECWDHPGSPIKGQRELLR